MPLGRAGGPDGLSPSLIALNGFTLPSGQPPHTTSPAKRPPPKVMPILAISLKPTRAPMSSSA
jgi:hypothetical protein